MKILLVTHQFLPDYSAGTEILTYNVAKNLLSFNHDVTVLTSHPERKDTHSFTTYKYEQISILKYSLPTINKKLNEPDLVKSEYYNEHFKKIFIEHLKFEKYDIVHFMHLARFSTSAIDVCKEFCIPIIFTLTDFWVICPTVKLLLDNGDLCKGPSKNGVNCIKHLATNQMPKLVSFPIRYLPSIALDIPIAVLNKKIDIKNPYFSNLIAQSNRLELIKNKLRLVNRILAPTDLMINLLKINEFSTYNIKKHSFGVNSSEKESPLYIKKINNYLTIGFIGSFSSSKGPHIILEAFKLINKERKINLKFYGDYKTNPSFEKLLESQIANDKRISFEGSFPNSDINKILSTLDLLIVPSLWYENTPLVIYSAQYSKVPVIASNLGGMSEVVNKTNGFLFEPGDFKALANIIQHLDDNRIKIKNVANNISPPKTYQEYVHELIEIYTSVADSPNE